MKKFLLISTLILTTALNLNAAENTASASKIGEFVWNELATSNVQQAKDFYSKVFGWEFVDKKAGEISYTFIQKEGKNFGGIWSIPAEEQKQIPPHWLAYILVENIEQSLAKARENGATVIKPIQKVSDMGLFAIITDPSGAHIALWQNLKS